MSNKIKTMLWVVVFHIQKTLTLTLLHVIIFVLSTLTSPPDYYNYIHWVINLERILCLFYVALVHQ